MELQGEHPGEEIKRLQRCVNDLVSILALPATWSGREPSQIVENLLRVLLDMLGLDLAYVRLEDPTGKSPIEMVRFAQPRSPAISAREIRLLLNQSLPEDPRKWPLSTRSRIGGDDISIVPRRLGLRGEIGVVIAGSQRLDFPGQTEALLLHVAANQAVIALQQARHLSEQTRFANELNQLVSQRTAQLAAANEELKLRAGLLQHIPVAAFTLNPEGTPDFVNENWLNYSGQTLEFVRSRPEAWMSAIHPDDRESNSKSFLDGVRSGHGFAMASRLRRNIDGSYRWHLNRAVPVRDAQGRILRFVGTSTDIEDLKQSQESLRKTEERTRMIIDTALDAVVSIDAHGSITSWNKEAEVIFGWSKEEAIGRQLAELIIPVNLRAAHSRGLARFLATGEGPVLRRRIEITAIRRSGVEFPVELEILPIKLGQDWSFSAFIRDITERKKAEAAQAAQTQQAGIRADVSAAFSEADNLSTILNSCADAIVRHLGAAFARIWTLNESENVLVLQASAGLYARLGGTHTRVPVGQFKIGRIAEEGKPHITNDVPNDERVSDRDWARREGMVAFAGYPLFVEGRVTGVLAMFARHPLDQTVLDALESVADIIAQGIYRRDAEDKLRQRERSLRLLTETIPQMIWSATTAGETDYCNRQMVEYTGRQEDQLRGNGWAEVIHPDDLPRIQESWRSAVANQLFFEMEFRQRRADGMFRWCLSRAQPLCDEQGRVIRWYGSITDLDDWKQAQEELRKAEDKLRRSEGYLAEGQRISSTGTFSWRLDTDEIMFSAELLRIFEFDPDAEVSLDRIGTRVHPEDIPFLSASIDRMRHSDFDSEYDIRLQMPDGRIKYVHTFGHVIQQQDGRRECLGAVQDITQRRIGEQTLDKLRSDLARVNRLTTIGELTASIAHEVNQPLGAVVANANACLRWLNHEPPNLEEVQAAIGRIIRDGNRGGDVIARIRGLMKKERATRAALDVNEIIRETIALLQGDLQGTTLRTDLTSGLPRVNADRVQLQQVLLNLMVNAMEAMKPVTHRPRVLSIQTKSYEGRAVLVALQDNGVGLNSEKTEKLFETFYTTKPEGLGMGLSICRSIIEEHGGRLWAESNEGSGARFQFTLPIERESNA